MARASKTFGRRKPNAFASFFRRPVGRVVLALGATCAAVCTTAAIANIGKARRQPQPA